MEIDFSSEMNPAFDTMTFVNLYESFLSITSATNIDETRLCLLAICNNWWQFHDGWSWGVARYYLGTKNDLKFWQKIIPFPEFAKLVTEFFKNQTNDLFAFSESIMKKEDAQQIKVYRCLRTEATKHWQWNNNYRFFIKDDFLYLPNGVQAKGNTAKIQF